MHYRERPNFIFRFFFLHGDKFWRKTSEVILLRFALCKSSAAESGVIQNNCVIKIGAWARLGKIECPNKEERHKEGLQHTVDGILDRCKWTQYQKIGLGISICEVLKREK